MADGRVTLYELSAKFAAVMAEADTYAAEHEGEIPADLSARIDAAEMAKDDKIGNCVAYMKSEDAYADMLIAEAEKLTRRAKSHSRNAEWMRGYLAMCVGAGTKWAGTQGKITWRNADSVNVTVSAELLPVDYQRVIPAKVEADKVAIKAALKAGAAVPGCELTTTQHIQIK